jgi:hypothetical protein
MTTSPTTTTKKKPHKYTYIIFDDKRSGDVKHRIVISLWQVIFVVEHSRIALLEAAVPRRFARLRRLLFDL